MARSVSEQPSFPFLQEEEEATAEVISHHKDGERDEDRANSPVAHAVVKGAKETGDRSRRENESIIVRMQSPHQFDGRRDRALYP